MYKCIEAEICKQENATDHKDAAQGQHMTVYYKRAEK